MNKFFKNRYGFDTLNYYLIYLLLIINTLSIFLKSTLLNMISIFILIYILSRAFSKKYNKRQQENFAFQRFIYPYKNKLNALIQRQKQKKYYKFYKCPNCKQTLRVPKGHGKITITCPKCNEKFDRKS